MPSQHCLRPLKQPHTPWWCEQHPDCSIASGDAGDEAAFAPVTTQIITEDSSTTPSLRIYAPNLRQEYASYARPRQVSVVRTTERRKPSDSPAAPAPQITTAQPKPLGFTVMIAPAPTAMPTRVA